MPKGVPRTLREQARRGGYGDKIMATGGDPDRPGYLIASDARRDVFNTDFRVEPGGLSLSREVRHWAIVHAPVCSHRWVILNPVVKNTHSADNKDWGRHKWERLAARAPWPVMQCLPPDEEPVPGLYAIRTPTFYHAAAMLSLCRGLVTTEGGMHHAAGALRKPAVVIFGAFNLPSMFGYDFHSNIAEPDPEGLGQRRPHPACRAAMERITVDRVLEAMVEMFE